MRRDVLAAIMSVGVVSGCGIVVDPLGNLSSGAGPSNDGGDVSTLDCTKTTAALCDTFDRTTPIPAGDARWQSVTCAPPGVLSVDGQLETSVPAVSGAQECTLDSRSVGASGSYTLDFDLTATFDASSTVVTIAGLSLSLSTPTADGRQNAFYSLVVDGQGRAFIYVTNYYPDVSRSPDPGNQYPGYLLGSFSGPWLIGGTRCHVRYSVDMVTPAASAEATCGSQKVTTQAGTDVAPAGFASNETLLGLGYQQSVATSVPAWSLTFDNVLLVRK